jgi:exopolyphosphatase / guanosine-5'-triphosphate,3'-diphosphate pyrophosphatase
MNLLKFAAIDIGTNAMRLLLANVIEDEGDTYFKKSSLIRMPIRLGEDVFEFEKIKKKRARNLIRMMNAFKLIMQANEVVRYRACATSAMREATNGQKLIDLVQRETGIRVELISGDEEAEIIRATQINTILASDKNWLFVDVGGGSTEITLFVDKNPVKSHSFEIGTIRAIKNMMKPEELEKLKDWVSEFRDRYEDLKIIGSGGNINKIFKFSLKKPDNILYYHELRKLYREIKSYSYDERLKILGFNPDRADVILPAAEVFLNIMQWADIGEIYVPIIGLADGIIQLEYQKFKKEIAQHTNGKKHE